MVDVLSLFFNTKLAQIVLNERANFVEQAEIPAFESLRSPL
jgi:hypothetical protein